MIKLLAVVFAFTAPATPVDVAGGNIRVEFDQSMHSRVIAQANGNPITLGPFTASESIRVNGADLRDFALGSRDSSSVAGKLGTANRVVLRGMSGHIEKAVIIDSYSAFPNVLFFSVEYTNKGNTDISVDAWTNNAYRIDVGSKKTEPAFWSLESGSYENRPDWVVPLKPGFYRRNYLGMNASDYGGGTPVSDIWRADVGLAVGHIELVPKLVSLPIAMPDAQRATLAVSYECKQMLHRGQSLRTFSTFVAVHTGDFFSTVRTYRSIMARQGVRLSQTPADGFEPIWCAWGFGSGFQVKQIYRALPTVEKLGFNWVTLDDGWQTNEGDWNPNPAKFPRGDADMKAFVSKIHADGLKAQLWWSPMSVSPSSQLMRDHPDWLLLDPSGAKRKISWWDSYYLCPAVPDVVAYHQQIVRKIIAGWGFDGLKIDGQFLNAVPPCTNPAHHHRRPEDSVEALPYFFRAIADAAKALKPGALIELCPCGTSYSFYSMPYYNMAVASDPESSWQVRSKGKTIKALMGDSLPYFGDHVELSDGGRDFASTVGVGGVIGTEFRWPPSDTANPPSDADTAKLVLTPEKEKIWAFWIKIYKEKMLSKGEYLGGLYDIGFDRPETHAIRKGNTMYYAFYAPSWKGAVELRGLTNKIYRASDYVHNIELGVVHGPAARLPVKFEHFLLIEADPINGR